MAKDSPPHVPGLWLGYRIRPNDPGYRLPGARPSPRSTWPPGFKGTFGPLPRLVTALTVGALGGWYSAVFGAIGYTAAATETYKTFAFPSKPRGKFANRPVTFPDLLVRRHWAVPASALIWLGIIVGALQAAIRA